MKSDPAHRIPKKPTTEGPINSMPQFIMNHLDGLFRFLTALAIVLPILGGFAGWGAWILGDKISDRDTEAAQQELESTKGEVATTRAELLATKSDLAATHSLAVKTEIATRPKTPGQRLVDFLNKLNPDIVSALSTQDVKFSGMIQSDDRVEYESLLRIPELAPHFQRLKLEVNMEEQYDSGITLFGATFLVRQSLVISTETK